VVERDEAFEDLLVGEVHGPAVGLGDRRVEVVVDLPQHADEALLVDRLLFGGEGFAPLTELNNCVLSSGEILRPFVRSRPRVRPIGHLCC
jgi:hypothetical protein